MIKKIFESIFDKKKKEGKEIGIEDMIKRIFERTFDKKKKGEEIAI